MMLNVIEIFKSIQGEGPATGTPAIFIRLAGCPVKCSWCDTDYTTGMKRMDEEDIINQIEDLGKGIIVLTGGEPLVQDVYKLIEMLHCMEHRRVHIETSCATECLPRLPALPLEVVCSPKTEFLSDAAMRATAWKYVIGEGMILSKEDGLPVGLARPLNDAPIYIQPLWDASTPMSKNDALAVAVVKKYHYRLSLQTHKYLGIK